MSRHGNKLIRCDLCPKRHRRGSKSFNEHLLGRAPDDLAEPTRKDLEDG